MNWAQPQWWWLLGVALVVMVVLWWTTAWHMRSMARRFGEGLLERILPPSVRTRRHARDALAVTGLLLLIVALAEPRFGKRLIELEAEGVDLVLVVDLSRSMDATDVDPSRLERARREILDLVDLMEGDRVGLVVYAGGPYPRMPLTLDYAALELVVRDLSTRTFQAQGSALGLAIREGLSLLSSQVGTAGQAMLVLSDGEVHDASDALKAAAEARDAGVPVYGLVIGSRPAAIPNGDGTFVVDPQTGVQVQTAPNAEVLKDVARITGGAVGQSVASNADVIALYRDTIRPSLRSAVNRQGQREAWTSAFQWPLGLGLICLLISAWIGDGKRVVQLALLLVMLPAVAQAQDGDVNVRDGDVAYRDGRYDEAVRVFTDLTLQRPNDAELFERLGAARYRAGDYNGAARAFARQAEIEGDVDAKFNAGNAYWMSGQLDRALEQYDDVLATEPSHPGATHNKDMLTQELQRRQILQQQQQLESEPQEGDDDPQQSPPQGEGEERPAQEGEGQPEPSQGDPDPNKPQEDAQSGGDGEQGDPDDASDPQGDASQSSSGEAGEEQSDGGTREDEGGGSDEEDAPPSLEDIQDGEPSDDRSDGKGGTGGEPTDQDPEGMTAEQADRVLESVEEGRPRVYIPGEGGDKPW